MDKREQIIRDYHCNDVHAEDCDFGLDNFEEEYEKYKFYVDEDMSYIDMMITIAHHVVEEEGAVF